MPSLLRPVLAVAALALCAALTACGGGATTSSSTPAPAPTQSTATTPTATTPTATTPSTTPTQTGAAGATITQVEAKAAARGAATRAAARHGVNVAASDWDVRCTAVGGHDRAATWRCQVASMGGQCAGSVTAYAAGPGLARTRQVDVTCTGY